MSVIDLQQERLTRRIGQLRREIERLESELVAIGGKVPPAEDCTAAPILLAVRDRIEARGITITTAAKEMGYTRQRLSALLKGNHSLGIRTIAILDDWLERSKRLSARAT